MSVRVSAGSRCHAKLSKFMECFIKGLGIKVWARWKEATRYLQCPDRVRMSLDYLQTLVVERRKETYLKWAIEQLCGRAPDRNVTRASITTGDLPGLYLRAHVHRWPSPPPIHSSTDVTSAKTTRGLRARLLADAAPTGPPHGTQHRGERGSVTMKSKEKPSLTPFHISVLDKSNV